MFALGLDSSLFRLKLNINQKLEKGKIADKVSGADTKVGKHKQKPIFYPCLLKF